MEGGLGDVHLSGRFLLGQAQEVFEPHGLYLVVTQDDLPRPASTISASTHLVAAQARRAAFGAAMDKLLAKLDFIVSPATPIPAFDVGPEVAGDVILGRSVNAGSFAFPINLSQQPAVSTPCGLTVAGLPIGLQFVGARGADAKVLSAARDFARGSR